MNGRCVDTFSGFASGRRSSQQQVAERFLELLGFGVAFAPRARAQVVDQKLGRAHAHIGAQQHRFQLLVEAFVELAPGAENTHQPAAELLPRLAEAFLQS